MSLSDCFRLFVEGLPVGFVLASMPAVVGLAISAIIRLFRG